MSRCCNLDVLLADPARSMHLRRRIRLSTLAVVGPTITQCITSKVHTIDVTTLNMNELGSLWRRTPQSAESTLVRSAIKVKNNVESVVSKTHRTHACSLVKDALVLFWVTLRNKT